MHPDLAKERIGTFDAEHGGPNTGPNTPNTARHTPHAARHTPHFISFTPSTFPIHRPLLKSDLRYNMTSAVSTPELQSLNGRRQDESRTVVPGVLAAVVALACLIIFTGCATPQGPQGGPPDREPPRLLVSIPAAGTTNVNTREIRMVFDEYVNRASFLQAVTIEPELGIRFKVEWKKTTAILVFESDLPSSTTLIVSLDNDLKDMRGNGLKESIKIPLSTGDEIDEGRIRVQVIDAATGVASVAQSVFLYRGSRGHALLDEAAGGDPSMEITPGNDASVEGAPGNEAPAHEASEDEPFRVPAYTAQTDTAGIARFVALADGDYTAIWVEDFNRNRRWEQEREEARPFEIETLRIREGQTIDDLGSPDTLFIPRVFISIPDTMPPILEAVGVLSQRLLRIRFNESLSDDITQPYGVLEVKENIENDSIHGATQSPDPASGLPDTQHGDAAVFTKAYPLFILPEDSGVVIAQTERALRDGASYTIAGQSGRLFADRAGNPWIHGAIDESASPVFTGSSVSDTSRLAPPRAAFAGQGQPQIKSDQPMEFVFNKLIEPSLAVPADTAIISTMLDSSAIILDAVRIPLRQAAAEGRLSFERTSNRLRIHPESLQTNGEWPTAPLAELGLYDPFQKTYTAYQPEVLTPDRMGALEITVRFDTPRQLDSLRQLESLHPPDNPQSTANDTLRYVIRLEHIAQGDAWERIGELDLSESTSDFSSIVSLTMSTDPLTPGIYRLTAFIDVDGDGERDPGSVIPFRLPEPFAAMPRVQVAAGLEGSVEILLKQHRQP